MSEPERPIDAALFDADTAASDDFYRHVNGGWLDANPVPSEYGSWGAPQIVHARNQVVLHQLLEDAAARTEPRGSAAQMVGDYFATAMDEVAIAAAGVTPLEPYLERVSMPPRPWPTCATSCAICSAAARARSTRSASRPTLRTRAPTSSTWARAGWGLPERDYYTRDDEQSAALRQQYVAHVANQLGNLGDTEERAREAAERILAFETRLAEASYTAEKLRDVQLTMNRYAVGCAGRAHAGLRPELGTSRRSASRRRRSSVNNPGFFRALDDHPRRALPWRRCGTTCAGTWSGRSRRAPARVRERGVRLLRAAARRAEGDAAAVEARAQRRLRGHRRTGGAALR